MKAILIAVVFLAGSLQGVSAQEIVVGFQTSLSGPVATTGVPLAKGIAAAQLHQQEVGGYKIRVVTLDDASDPSAAARNARKLIEDQKVDIILGSAGSPMTTSAAVVSYEMKVPMIALSPIGMPREQGDWHIVINQPPSLMVDADVAHMKKKGVKSVGFIGFSDTWGDLVIEALTKATAANGIEIVAAERYGRSDSSVTAQILRILARTPDAIVNGGAGGPGALPYLALADRNYKGPIYATHAIVTNDFVRVGGKAINGAIAPTGPVVVGEQLPAGNPIRDVTVRYRELYQKANNEPGRDAIAPYAYDGWLVFLAAAKKAVGVAKPGTPEFRTALRDALASVKDVVGLHGVYNFAPGRNYGVDERARVLVEMKDGQWHLLAD